MPSDGDTKIVRKGLTFNKYTYIVGEPGYADGWWDANETPPAYGGAGEEVDTNAVDPGPPASAKPSDAALLYEAENPGEAWPPTTKDKNGDSLPDNAEMRYWQSEVFRQRKAAADATAKATETARLEAAKAAKTQQASVGDTLGEAFKRGQQSGDFTEYQQLLAASKPPPSPPKTPTADELLIEAILNSGKDGGAAAMALWNFMNMPSQAERLKMAIAASQSPADYLAAVGMMRGEIPIPFQPGGNNWRLGPESQAFAAYGLGGQGGGGAGTATNLLEDPALQSFLQARGGGSAQTNAPGGQTAAVAQNSPALNLIDRQIEALVAAGDQAQKPEEQAQIQQQMTQLQTQRQQVWQQERGATTQPGTQPRETTPASPDGLTTEQKVRREAGLETSGGLATFGPERDIQDPNNPNMIGVRDPYGTVRWANKNDQDSVNWARNYTKPQPWTPGTNSNQAAAGKLPSFLEGAYGKEALSGAALTQRMSYPELAERQGVTMPRYRSAQARSMQTPLEQRMFEAGLQKQFGGNETDPRNNLYVQDWLAQEGAGTTPRGSRRRRVMTGY